MFYKCGHRIKSILKLSTMLFATFISNKVSPGKIPKGKGCGMYVWTPDPGIHAQVDRSACSECEAYSKPGRAFWIYQSQAPRAQGISPSRCHRDLFYCGHHFLSLSCHRQDGRHKKRPDPGLFFLSYFLCASVLF